MSLFTGSRAILASVAVVAIVAGCANGATASPQPTAAAASPAPSLAATAPAATPAASTAASAYEVKVAQGGAGAYLTGEDGKALYLFEHDKVGTSTCTGDCATTWPPFVLDGGETVTAGTGVTGTLSTISRPDGSKQVAINGLPMYYFSGDSAAGQTNGQGIGHVWFLASPAGTFVGM